MKHAKKYKREDQIVSNSLPEARSRFRRAHGLSSVIGCQSSVARLGKGRIVELAQERMDNHENYQVWNVLSKGRVLGVGVVKPPTRYPTWRKEIFEVLIIRRLSCMIIRILVL